MSGLTLDTLIPDPRNARKHTKRNLDAIVGALREVGAARSIVIDETGTILAGNATVKAAREVGIDQVHIVEADGKSIIAVRRVGLSEDEKLRLALLDNRAAELAEREPTYCDVILRRYEAETGKAGTLLERLEAE